MCGRYPSTRAAPLIDAIEAAQVADAAVAGVLAKAPGMPKGLTSWWAPRWNVAPTQPVRAIVLADGAPRLTLARWGLRLNAHKTRIVHLDQGLSWLGYFFVRNECYEL